MVPLPWCASEGGVWLLSWSLHRGCLFRFRSGMVRCTSLAPWHTCCLSLQPHCFMQTTATCSLCTADYTELAADDNLLEFRLFPCVAPACDRLVHGTCFRKDALFYFTQQWHEHARCGAHIEQRNQELKTYACPAPVTVVVAKYTGTMTAAGDQIVRPLTDKRRMPLQGEQMPEPTFAEVRTGEGCVCVA